MLETDRDPSNRTADSQEICFDVLNASKQTTLIFTDFSPERAAQRMHRRNGFGQELGLPPNFPPAIIEVPPLHMATMPDHWYRGRTKDGTTTNDVYHLLGDRRPLRKTRRRFSGGKLLVSAAAPSGWKAVPLNARAWAEIEAVKAKGGG
jgi:hypothetical protein